MKYRIEKDTMGEVKVPMDRYWGAQTERSRNNFKIGPDASMPLEIILGFAILKKAAAHANHELKVLSRDKKNAIVKVCDEILNQDHNDQFPLVIWQTGSGTQSNMNINEVIANVAHINNGGKIDDIKKTIHPNDDVNKSQSSNDTFPTAMHIAAVKIITEKTIPAITKLREALNNKAKSFSKIVVIGRTHLMDATPLTLGQEFSGYVAQLDYGIRSLKNSIPHLCEIAIGGTAVGTGLNSPKGYSKLVAKKISDFTKIKFSSAKNKFEALSANDAFVETHSALKQIAVSLNKIANDIRLLASGPRCGIGELNIPSNEPGSSIMPGKVNPTQIEALTMICAQIIGNDMTITTAGMQGQLQLNVYKPVIAANFIQSAKLLSDGCDSFEKNCVLGISPNHKNIENNLKNSLMLITALNTKIGYEKASEIAKNAHKNGTTLKEEALRLNYVTKEEFEKWVDPKKMCNK
ncbi:MAG: class II fumarate hydratase [Flavobacteriales bacterium]|jgi:fumarate hydratase class II|nr:class II fumarate hydratase [Flavobacteriales bacterium]